MTAQHTCWKCEYDVSDQVSRGDLVCPECGSPLDDLEARRNKRTRLSDRRKTAIAKGLAVPFVLVGSVETLGLVQQVPDDLRLSSLLIAYLILIYAFCASGYRGWTFGGPNLAGRIARVVVKVVLGMVGGYMFLIIEFVLVTAALYLVMKFAGL